MEFSLFEKQRLEPFRNVFSNSSLAMHALLPLYEEAKETSTVWNVSGGTVNMVVWFSYNKSIVSTPRRQALYEKFTAAINECHFCNTSWCTIRNLAVSDVFFASEQENCTLSIPTCWFGATKEEIVLMETERLQAKIKCLTSTN